MLELLNFPTLAPRLMTLCLCASVLACSGGARDIKRSHTRLELAKDFLRKGEFDAADIEAGKALAFDKQNAEAHYVLGLVDLMRSRRTHELLEIQECLTGIDADALFQDKVRALEDADVHFANAIVIDRELGEAWAARGTTATLLGRYEDAISYFQEALVHPARLQNIALVRANLGWAYFESEDLVSAAKELLQAKQFQPGMCVATYRLGRVYFAREEWEKALQQFRDVAGSLGCPIQDAHLYMMKTYLALGMTDELPGTEKSCVAMAPNSCVAVQCRALGASASALVGPEAGMHGFGMQDDSREPLVGVLR